MMPTVNYNKLTMLIIYAVRSKLPYILYIGAYA